MANPIGTPNLKIINPPSPAQAGFGGEIRAPFQILLTVNHEAGNLFYPKSKQGTTSFTPKAWEGQRNIDITDFVKSISWSQSREEHAVSVDLVLDNYRGLFNQIPSGSRVIIRTRRPFYSDYGTTRGKYYPYITSYVFEKEKSGSGSEQTMSWKTYDRAYWLANNPVKQRVFKEDRKHPRGWTATQMIQAMAKDLGIEVGRIDASVKQIKRHEVKGKFLDEIRKILKLDKDAAARKIKYDIHMRDGKLNVVKENPSPKSVWHFTDPDMIEQGTMSEALGKRFATRLTVIASEKYYKTTKKGKRYKNKSTRKIKVEVRAPAGYSSAFGDIHKTIKLPGHHTKATLKTAAKAKMAEAIRPERSFSFECRGVPFLWSGSRVFITSKYFGVRGLVAVKSVSYNLDGAAFTMTLDVTLDDTTNLSIQDERLYYKNQGIRY